MCVRLIAVCMKFRKDKLTSKYKIAIIGGGLGGLTAAFRLLELRQAKQFEGDFLLLEAADKFGGAVGSIRRDGFLLETGADAFLSEKPEALSLTKRLGLESELLATNEENRRTFIVRHGRLRPIPQGFRLIAPIDLQAFFASDILSRRGKIRLANERFLQPTAPQNDESLANFVRRRFGVEALDRIAQPMFAGIYAANPENLSMRATQPRFLDLEQKFGSVIEGFLRSQIPDSKFQDKKNPKSEIGSGARYGLFLSFKNGMQTLIEGLASKLPEDCFHLSAQTLAVRFDKMNRQWQIRFADEKTLVADAIILALPAHQIAKLLENQFPALAKEFAEIESASTATINFAFRREQILHALDGFGFVVPFVEKRNLMAATFSSVKFSNRAPENHVLLRAFVGGMLQTDKFALSDEEMIFGCLQDLRDLIGLIGEPIFTHTARWARSMPQYAVGHLAKAERIKNLLAENPSLAIATTAVDGVGMPDTIRHAEQAAEKLTDYLNYNKK
jgi:oxygen-dependent protoporphyrinogen oxidase